jgi:hypothetical protein
MNKFIMVTSFLAATTAFNVALDNNVIFLILGIINTLICYEATLTEFKNEKVR